MIPTGLFFGSFNPIHVGHLMLAQAALNFSDVDEVWFVVSPQNPFKQQADLAPSEHRLRMAEIATGSDSRMSVSDVEMSLPLPSFTVRTLEKLRSDYPEREFSIIMGGDNLAGLPRWREPDEIVRHHRIVVYPRPGQSVDTSAVKALGGCVSILDAPQMDLSSTMLRCWIAEGRCIRHFVPSGVDDYIASNNLYVPR